MFPFLTLDKSTLFYWTLSNASSKKQKHISAINEWTLAIPTNTSMKSTSQGPKSSSSCTKYNIASLINGVSHSSASSVLSNNVKIIHQASNATKSKSKPVPDASLSIHWDGGLLNNEEIRGNEWEVAINSPPKGKRHITSQVNIFFFS